jgi:uncharacterized protein
MLVEFSVKNYLSFNESMTFSMVGSKPVKELEGDENQNENNIFYDPSKKNKMLHSAVIYGANGSGKSNLFNAMDFVRTFVLTSANDSQATDEINVLNFLFNEENSVIPSSFEIVFYIEQTMYRYGFEVDKGKVHSEWLFRLLNEPSAKETQLFTREFQSISPNARSFKEGKNIEDKTRPNALFLSVAAQFNGEISKSILNWFKYNFNIISGLENTTINYTVSKYKKDEVFKKKLIEFFKLTNIGIQDIIVEEEDLATPDMSDLVHTSPEISNATTHLINEGKKIKSVEAKRISIFTLHKTFSKENLLLGNAALDFNLESKGTQKLFSLLGPLLDTLESGKILIIDELDSRLHPLLTMELVKLFHSKFNTKNAQLIFASHDTNLLRKDIFRRDQIWFAEKDEFGASDLYSLVEYKINQATAVRNDASFEKDYLLGKYGGIPFFGNIQNFLNEFIYEQEQIQ